MLRAFAVLAEMKTIFTIATVAGAGVLYAWSLHQSRQIRQIYRNW